MAGRRVHGGVLLIPCLLHDAYRYWFLADTGAARTLLTPTVAEEIGLDPAAPIRHEQIASVHHVTRVPVVRISSLQAGIQRLTEVEALVMALPADLRIDGLSALTSWDSFVRRLNSIELRWCYGDLVWLLT